MPSPSAPSDDLAIRFAKADDTDSVLYFIRALAAHTKHEHLVVADEDTLRTALFGPRPGAEVLLAELAGKQIGFALFFQNFSTFLGRPGLYLEDLFVEPAARGKGAGIALMSALARICVERNYGRFDWLVLDWNEPSLEFYKALGAEAKAEYQVHRLTGAPLARLADRWSGAVTAR